MPLYSLTLHSQSTIKSDDFMYTCSSPSPSSQLFLQRPNGILSLPPWIITEAPHSLPPPCPFPCTPASSTSDLQLVLSVTAPSQTGVPCCAQVGSSPAGASLTLLSSFSPPRTTAFPHRVCRLPLSPPRMCVLLLLVLFLGFPFTCHSGNKLDQVLLLWALKCPVLLTQHSYHS